MQDNRDRLASANLSLVNLSGANLSEAVFSGTDLRGTNLSNSNLTGCVFIDPKLEGANFNGADLASADFAFVNFDGVSMRGANLLGAQLSESRFLNSDLTGANLSNAWLWRCDFENANLSRAVFSGAEFKETWFEPAQLPEVEALVGATGLRSLKVRNDYGPIEKLRDAAYAHGLRKTGAELTCSIRRNLNDHPERAQWQTVLHFYLFDATCAYGASPLRALALFLALSLLYVCAIRLEVVGGQKKGNIAFRFHAKSGGTELVGATLALSLRRHRSLLQKLFDGPFITATVAVALVVNLCFGNWLVERFTSIAGGRPVGVRACGYIRAGVVVYVFAGLYLLILWGASSFGRPFG